MKSSPSLAFGSPPIKVAPDTNLGCLSMRNMTPDFSHLIVFAYVFCFAAIIVIIWSIISIVKSKKRISGKVLSIILSGSIIAICLYILSMNNHLTTHEKKNDLTHEKKNDLVIQEGIGLVYESNASIYKDDVSSNSRLLITRSEWITKDIVIWSAYHYKDYEYIDDEENFSIHVRVPMGPTGERGNKSRMFKIQLAEDGYYYTVEPFEIKLESEDAEGIQVGYFFRISDFYQICNSFIVSAVFESPSNFGELIQINETNIGILRGQIELIKERLAK